jgi:hypothetical protein
MTIRSSALIGIRQRRPTLAIALKTGSLTSALMFVGLLGACSLDASNVGMPVAALTKSAAENHFLFTRLDHAVVNQHSTAHDSDLPGASIAQYEQSTGEVLTLFTEPFESGFVGSDVLASPAEPFESGFVGSQVLAAPTEIINSSIVHKGF